MKLAVVAGGWHWPCHFYRAWAKQSVYTDLFVVAHRSPELPIVRNEKMERLLSASGPLAKLDLEMYCSFLTIPEIKALGWHYQEAPNTVGDMEFFNQWLATHDYKKYDLILNCHDDLFIRSPELLARAQNSWEKDKWLILANGRYPGAPEGYVRGSFAFWSKEMLDILGGHIYLGRLPFTRVGKVNTPVGMGALSLWNQTSVPLRKLIKEKGLVERIAYLSPYYRISPWVIECERGFLNQDVGAHESFQEGLKELAPELVTPKLVTPKQEPVVKGSITVYTIIIDDYDELKPPRIVEPGVRYICFSNRHYNCPPWEIVRIEKLYVDPRRSSRVQKIMSHLYIQSEYSIYHDGSCSLVAKPSDLVREFLSKTDLAMYKHPVRTTIYEEKDVCIKLGICSIPEIQSQISRYKGNVPGLWSGGIIFRRNTEAVKKFNETWWKEYSVGCIRDQIALPRAIMDSGIEIHTIQEVINTDKNRFKFHYHRNFKRALPSRRR